MFISGDQYRTSLSSGFLKVLVLVLQVFKKSFIPRTLDQVINIERDFVKAQIGETDEVYFV